MYFQSELHFLPPFYFLFSFLVLHFFSPLPHLVWLWFSAMQTSRKGKLTTWEWERSREKTKKWSWLITFQSKFEWLCTDKNIMIWVRVTQRVTNKLKPHVERLRLFPHSMSVQVRRTTFVLPQEPSTELSEAADKVTKVKNIHFRKPGNLLSKSNLLLYSEVTGTRAKKLRTLPTHLLWSQYQSWVIWVNTDNKFALLLIALIIKFKAQNILFTQRNKQKKSNINWSSID